jgi:hypothetical protein
MRANLRQIAETVPDTDGWHHAFYKSSGDPLVARGLVDYGGHREVWIKTSRPHYKLTPLGRQVLGDNRPLNEDIIVLVGETNEH